MKVIINEEDFSTLAEEKDFIVKKMSTNFCIIYMTIDLSLNDYTVSIKPLSFIGEEKIEIFKTLTEAINFIEDYIKRLIEVKKLNKNTHE